MVPPTWPTRRGFNGLEGSKLEKNVRSETLSENEEYYRLQDGALQLCLLVYNPHLNNSKYSYLRTLLQL